MESKEFYSNAIKKISSFYEHQYNENNAEKVIFETLNSIIPLKSGFIYMQNSDTNSVRYKYGSRHGKFKLVEELSIGSCKFGSIEISRDTAFFNEEKEIFKTCSAIISNIIKEIELSSIIKMQVKALQDGIEETKKQNKKIIASDKIKNDFIANVSHELRSPLNSIIGFSELLQSKFIGELNEKQQEYISDIRIAGLHLLGMINEILDISKIEANAINLNKTAFNLKQNMIEVTNILKPLYEKKNITLYTNIADDIDILADYQKIQQIFFNLLSNAIKFTPEGGKINISAEKTSRNLTIKITDNGIGIEKKNIKKIFKKFVQLNSAGVKECSTGLGLTITQELIKLHNGKINVESLPNAGTTFIIEIPEVVF